MARDFAQESRTEFWERPENLSIYGKPGAHLEEYRELLKCLEDNPDAVGKEVLFGEKVPATPIATFRNTSSKTGKAYAFVAENTDVLKQRSKEVWVAIDPDVETPGMLRLKLSPDGQLVNMDSGEEKPTEDELESLLAQAINAIRQQTKNTQYRIDERRRERRNRVKAAGGVLAVVGALAGGTWAGLEHWKFGPERADKEQRIAYDKEHHLLDGTTIAITNDPITTLPKSQFNKIPKLSDEDDLSNPRIIEIVGNDCTTLSGTLSAGSKLTFALAEGDPLTGSTVGATKSRVGKKIAICLVGKDSPDADSGNGAEASKLAVQIQK